MGLATDGRHLLANRCAGQEIGITESSVFWFLGPCERLWNSGDSRKPQFIPRPQTRLCVLSFLP